MATAVVTGSASGIGKAVRVRLEADGYAVTGVDRHDAEIVGDLSTPNGRDNVVQALYTRGAVLDRVVLCAGVGPEVGSSEIVARVNYYGAERLMDPLLDLLAPGANPSLVVISSTAAGLVDPAETLPDLLLDGEVKAALARSAELHPAVVYAATKNAVARAVRRRAPRWAARGVRINAIAPGPVNTPMMDRQMLDPDLKAAVENFPVPISRWAEPHEVANVVAWMMGPQASLMTGSVIFVDNGTDALARPDSI